MTIDKIINEIKERSKNCFPDHLIEMEKFIRERVKHYGELLNIPEEILLRAMEEKRTYSAPNYYQDRNFPILNDVRLFKNQEELKEMIPSKKFRCCVCKGETTDPYECNSGRIVDKKTCDWKTYGLFGTMGNGFRFAFTENFIDNPKVDEIFMPIDFE